jgi:hypothetical protein
MAVATVIGAMPFKVVYGLVVARFKSFYNTRPEELLRYSARILTDAAALCWNRQPESREGKRSHWHTFDCEIGGGSLKNRYSLP